MAWSWKWGRNATPSPSRWPRILRHTTGEIKNERDRPTVAAAQPHYFLSDGDPAVVRPVCGTYSGLGSIGGGAPGGSRQPSWRGAAVLLLRHAQGADAADRHRVRDGHDELRTSHPSVPGRCWPDGPRASPTSWRRALALSRRSAPARRCRYSSASSRRACRLV